MTAVFAIAYNTVREALSRRVVLLFLFGALVLIVLSPLFSFLSPREELTLLKSLGLGVIQLASMFICIVMGISLIPAEIERRTIYTVLSKPVQRYEFVLGKFLGGILTMLFNILCMGVVFFVVVAWRGNVKQALDLWKGFMMIFFQMSILVSLAIFFSAFLTPFVNFFMSLGVYIIGTLSSVTESLMKGENRTALQKGIGAVLHYLLPNFGNFNIQNKIIHPETRIINEGVYYIQNIGYAVLYIAVLLIIAVIIFDRREV